MKICQTRTDKALISVQHNPGDITIYFFQNEKCMVMLKWKDRLWGIGYKGSQFGIQFDNEFITQENFNIDHLDGFGISGLVANNSFYVKILQPHFIEFGLFDIREARIYPCHRVYGKGPSEAIMNMNEYSTLIL